jgi:phage-related protein
LEKKREIVYFRSYFFDFFEAQPTRVREKIEYVLYLVTVAERIPGKFFKSIDGTDGLFEIRVEFESNIYRIFCCFDEGMLVILLNGFQKKTQRTPKREIEKANRFKREYFREKKLKT